MTDAATLLISVGVSVTVSISVAWLYLDYVRPWLVEKGVVARV